MKLMNTALAGASVLAIVAASTAAQAAQPAPAAPAAAAAEDITLGEIVVTARRRSESLQEVPQTVNAVSSDTLQKLNITQFTDVGSVVPGLSLENNPNGYQASASMRGVTFDVNTAAPLGTVATYINDAPVQTSILFNSVFDIGQIEVLRGPQGTTRGVSTPSGAMTVTTRRPDLSSFGGYANVTATDQHGRNAQGAVNIPIINDVLAVRVAGVIDQTDAGGVRSIHNPLRPSAKTMAERFSVSFEPSDRFDANVMYQHLDNRYHVFDQVSGPGQGAFVNPALAPFDRASVEAGITDSRTHQDLATAQIDSRIYGQHLSYVGMYAHTKTHARNLGVTNPGDVGNIISGIPFYNFEDVTAEYTTHEIRLASDPEPGRFWDYTAGGFYSWQSVDGTVVAPEPLTLGALGSPLGPIDLAAYNPRYTLLQSHYEIPSSTQEYSVFGNLTLHLGKNTELSGGLRHIWSSVNNGLNIHFGNGLVALPSAALPFGGGCGPFPSTYAGTCDTPLTLASLGIPSSVIALPSRSSATKTIYNISLSHHFSRDLLVYANTGSSFRPGFFSPGIQGPLQSSPDPVLQSLSNHPAETSKSYEVGVKWTFLDGRARINADIYRQKFKNFTIYIPNINYFDGRSNSNFQFTQPVDAQVEGFELDGALQITHNWNVGLQASYADGEVQGTEVVCNTFDAAGAPTYNHTFVSFCPGGSASRLPYWNATLTSEYNHEVATNVDGFIRGLFSYYPKNENRAEPNFTVDSHGLLNLYAGVRSQDGAWEVSLFAKNALRDNTVLDKSPVPLTANTMLVPQIGYAGRFPTSSGYFTTQVTPRREVGINVRYAFGSR